MRLMTKMTGMKTGPTKTNPAPSKGPTVSENHKTPYHLTKCGIGCHRHIEASDGTKIGTINVIGDSDEVPNFVITACNSHAALVEENERLKGIIVKVPGQHLPAFGASAPTLSALLTKLEEPAT